MINLKATNKKWSDRISKKLASNFIELGYGLQVEGMSAEMFFNRSFEPFFSYRHINKIWFDLLEDETDPTSHYETDWSVFDWYHSSYEHNPWFAFPGSCTVMPITDNADFIVKESPVADVKIDYSEDSVHGKYAIKVTNNSDAEGGLAQAGKYCFAGMTYTFKGKIRRVSGSGNIYMAMFKEETTTEPVVKVMFDNIGEEYSLCEASFKIEEEGRYTFCILIPVNSAVLCDDFTMMPDDNVNGWKKNAVEAGKFVKPAVIRWPGGCFSSFYDWRDGVGEYRPPMYSYFWGGYQYNDIGTDELASYAESIGAESMVCLNMYHPFKRFFDYVPPESMNGDPNDRTLHAAPHGRDLPQFTDKEQGAKDAALWVEYCNGDETTEGGRMRIANGRKEPYNIKYWEMDNEIHRWFTYSEYAEECVRYSRAMKAVDPSIKIGMVSYCHGVDLLAEMVEIAGQDIDFFADRGFAEEELIAKLGVIKRYNEAHGTNIKYCNTEWLPLNGADVYNLAPRDANKYTKCFLFSKWSYALDAAAVLMMWQRYGQSIDFINFNNFANTHSQSVIETAKEGSYITAAGRILNYFANTKAAYALRFDGYHPVRTDNVQIQLSLNESGDALVINVLNRSETEEKVHLDLSDFDIADHCTGTMLYADNLLAMNTLNDTQIKEKQVKYAVNDKSLDFTAEPLSYSEVIVAIK